MIDSKIIDLFGELELGTFENDIMEEKSFGLGKRIKMKSSHLLEQMKKNILKITAVVTGIVACVACVTGVIIICIKKSKRKSAIA